MEETCPNGFYYQHDNKKIQTSCEWYLEEAGVEQSNLHRVGDPPGSVL